MKGYWKQFWHCVLRFHRAENHYVSGPPYFKDVLFFRGCWNCKKEVFFGMRLPNFSEKGEK